MARSMSPVSNGQDGVEQRADREAAVDNADGPLDNSDGPQKEQPVLEEKEEEEEVVEALEEGNEAEETTAQRRNGTTGQPTEPLFLPSDGEAPPEETEQPLAEDMFLDGLHDTDIQMIISRQSRDKSIPFPWDKVLFCVPDFVPQPARDIMRNRIKSRGGVLAALADKPDVIVHVPDTVGDLQNAIQNEEADLRGGDTIIRYSDWLARLYGSGIAAAGLDNFPPLTLDNKTPLVTVFGGSEEWGGETLRRRVMVNLEYHGAIAVSISADTDVCILPPGHVWLTKPPKTRVKFVDESWIQTTIEHSRRPPTPERSSRRQSHRRRRNDSAEETDGNAGAPDDEEEESERPRPRKQQRSSRPARPARPPKRPVVRSGTRIAYTKEERDLLARWLAFTCPETVGRTTFSLYETLVDQRSWAREHSAQSWHEHYRKTRGKSLHGMASLDELIEQYSDAGIDVNLRTEAEREAQRQRDEARRAA